MFDPYHKWLGILPKDQPPHHYRLLGLEPYEKDLDVIEGAADRAMGFIRQYQAGEHAASAAKLLNEIATARLCLLKPKAKADYDAKLKREIAAQEAAKVDTPAFVDDAEVAALMKASKPAPKPASKKKKKKSESDPTTYLIAGGLGAVAFVVVVVIALKAGGKSSATAEPGERIVARADENSSSIKESMKEEQQIAAQVVAPVTISVPTAEAPNPAQPANKAAAFQRWMSEVGEMQPEQQVNAVADKLKELNPGFDRIVMGDAWKGSPDIENNVVTKFKFYTDRVNDISPVRALQGLKVLGLRGSGKGSRGQLRDLSPIQGMKLEQVDCSNTQVVDLSPLKGMPLTHLHINDLNVSDLSPLRGMPLNDLRCFNTKIFDLSPLQDSPLSYGLYISGTDVSDLSPLQGKQLKELRMNKTKVSDLSPLKGMPLIILECSQTEVSDLSPLKNMNLQEVRFSPRKIKKGGDVIVHMKSLQRIAFDGPYFPAKDLEKQIEALVAGKKKKN